MITSTLVKDFGTQAAEPFDIVEQDGMAEEFTRGCYGGRGGAGMWTRPSVNLSATRQINHPVRPTARLRPVVAYG